MPDLDVADLTFDLDFAEQLTITRRQQTVNGAGLVQMTSTTIDPAPWGVVIPQADLPLQRGPSQQSLPRLLQVHTMFRLRSASVAGGVTYEPDILTWNGDPYVCNKVSDFSHYGAGFICADFSAQPTVQQAPV